MILLPHLYLFQYKKWNICKNKYLILEVLVLLLFNERKEIDFSDPDHFIVLMFFKVCLEVLQLKSIKRNSKQR